jgi:hypothetical protein
LDIPFPWGASIGSRGAKKDFILFFGSLTALAQFANGLVELPELCVFPPTGLEKNEAIDVCAL